ncbi:hypothetical protein HYPSUDRAFT_40385 [Hypholoma sublateritium FD-334 SS-4]|uniref:Uncharacterized protein n=1 Tax=Hypholoma sublateritium (strain FD-334 SS-4) TaxID=945553 RepID=A0A0D2P2F4_HYPSF|nr:hypothetical protein HYPSUDRAFT_40385 [Hypholoma sublateritium FD-334 SS-4]
MPPGPVHLSFRKTPRYAWTLIMRLGFLWQCTEVLGSVDRDYVGLMRSLSAHR